MYKLARVRLSIGVVFFSKRSRQVPSVGHVPGGESPQTLTGMQFQQPSQPEIISADWGIGEPNYLDKTELLQGYLRTNRPDLRASNQFFHDDYPNEAKHLRVRYRWSGSAEVETRTFAENDRITFS